MPRGILDTTYVDFPDNIDTAYIQGLETEGGVDMMELIREIDARIGAFNAGLDSLVASLVFPTTEPFLDGTSPVAFVMNESGEYTFSRPQLTEPSGAMLPIRGYDISLGWTEKGLRKLSRANILNNIDSMLLGFRRGHRLKTLERLFSNAELRVDPRTTATSPGFAGSGTGGNVYDRPYPNGTPLPGGYSHYYFANTDNAGELDTVLKAGIARLKLQGHVPPFDMTGSQAFLDLVMASSDFVDAGSALVRQGANQAEANVDPLVYEGVYAKEVRVRTALQETTSPNGAIYKSQGLLNEGNPLAWRYDEKVGREAYLRYRDFFPLGNAVMLQEFGIGVNNRTAAVLFYAASGASAYVNPTFA